MLKGFVAVRKYLVIGIAAAAPIVGVGCDSCNTVKTSPCAPIPVASVAPCAPKVKTSSCTRYRAAPPRAVAAKPCGPVVVTAPVSAPVTYVNVPAVAAPIAAAPVVYQEAVLPDSTLAFGSASRAVTYKPIPSRNYAAAISNIDQGDVAVVRNSSAGSPVLNSVVTPGDLAAAGISYPVAAGYSVADVSIMGDGFIAESAIPAAGYVVSESPAYSVPVAVGPARRGHPARRPAHRRRGAVETVAAAPSAYAGIPSGTPVYITPGGTPVSAYVPAPASGTYLDGAAPTGYLPVTERRGPHNAVVHYSTRSICKYDPIRGEDCVWTSGF